MDLGENIWKNRRKTHILGKIRGPVPVQVRVVPVQIVFYFAVLTSVRILTIPFSFLIRFELFKLQVKIDFKENQTS